MCCCLKIKACLAKIIAIFLLSIAVMQPSYALCVEDVLQPSNVEQNYIVDLADVIDRDTEAEINKAIAILEANKNKTIYIITVPFISYKPTQKRFKIVPAVSESRRFLESILLNWNIEPLKQRNTISIFISTGDRSIEIKSAFNLKYIIQDRHIQGIIDKIMIPKFKHQGYATGVLLATKTIIKKVDNPYYNLLPTPQQTPWQSKLKFEFKSRNIPSSKGYAYDNSYPNEISYYGGSGTW